MLSRSAELFCDAASSSLRCTETFSGAAVLIWRRLILQQCVRRLGITAGGEFCSASPCASAALLRRAVLLRRRRADRLRQQAGDVLARRHRAEAGHAVRIVEVPRILDQADEVANCRIGGPSATKRRTRELRRNAGFEERADVGFGADRFDRRQAGGIERSLGGAALSSPAGAAAGVSRRRPSLCLGRRGQSAAGSSAASRLRRDHRSRNFSGSLMIAHRRVAERAAPALPDRRGRACA